MFALDARVESALVRFKHRAPIVHSNGRIYVGGVVVPCDASDRELVVLIRKIKYVQ